MKWYFNDIRIAQINGDPSKTCTDVQCKDGEERFRGRLKLDHQTGSLTITNTRTTDAGLYKLLITSGGSDRERIFSVTIHAGTQTENENGIRIWQRLAELSCSVPDLEAPQEVDELLNAWQLAETERVSVSVSVMEGVSVTLHTGVEKKQQDRMKWYFNDIRIAQINGDPKKTCTDVQCNEGDERFRGRLKLDHQTGSLTIMNTRNTDAGEYQLLISSGGSDREKIFSVTVRGVSAAERDKMKRKSVKEGESVILDPGVTKNLNDSMMWYFKDTLIAEITGDQSKICTDVQCDERFRDRLNLDPQTGSLTIMNTRNTDSGEYQLESISGSVHRRRRSIRVSSVKSFDVTVTDALAGSGLSEDEETTSTSGQMRQ
ncbi:hypothetical protein DPX16_1127 [Anabarilius grahami]|uniref:Immunoglobulin domain-containing protein n=1 Tax=Anabarilius grahami TaxID=495550 RepID=A0A3N0YXL6_ANAGA|nr:hypothetical protein DPX16_1127 [Anabarilius grahami]